MKTATQENVTYVVPFYWGYFIDISHLLTQGYRTIQNKLIDGLNELTGDSSWFIEDQIGDERVWNMKENNVYGGNTKLGTSFLARQILPKREFNFDNFLFTIQKLIFFYHEFGVATCRLSVGVKPQVPVEIQNFEDVTRDSNIVNEFLEFINTFIRIDCKVIREKLIENKIPISIDAKHFKELISSETIQVGYRKALWEHVIYQFEIDKTDPIRDEDLLPFYPLINSSQQSGATDSSLDEKIRAYPGFGTSLILTTTDRNPEDTNLIRVLEIAEYYYAATRLLDDFMYDKFTTFYINRLSTLKISTIQMDLDETKSLSNLLEAFLFNLKDSIINFNPTAKLIWRTLEKEWYYSPMVDSLQEKSLLLNEKYRDLLNELNEKRSETLNKFVKIFTVFAVLGPAIELYSLIESRDLLSEITSLPPFIIFILIVILVGIVISLGLFAFTKLRKFYF